MISKDNVFRRSIYGQDVVFVCRLSLMVICQFHIVASSPSDTTPVTHQSRINFPPPSRTARFVSLKEIIRKRILKFIFTLQCEGNSSISFTLANTVTVAEKPLTQRLRVLYTTLWSVTGTATGPFKGHPQDSM
jgi:hypothetical protein